MSIIAGVLGWVNKIVPGRAKLQCMMAGENGTVAEPNPDNGNMKLSSCHDRTSSLTRLTRDTTTPAYCPPRYYQSITRALCATDRQLLAKRRSIAAVNAAMVAQPLQPCESRASPLVNLSSRHSLLGQLQASEPAIN